MQLKRVLAIVVAVLAMSLLPVLAGAAPATQTGATVGVDAVLFDFEPRELVVAPGTTVVWTNLDSVPHTVTADDGSYDSGDFGRGETYSRTFTTPGRYQYYCIPHGAPGLEGMAGVIVVEQPAAPVPPPPPPATQPPAPPAPTPPPGPPAAPYCVPGQPPTFRFGFAALSERLGTTMGDPITCEYGDPNGSGDTLQNTTNGLAFYRASTNTPTFTTGFEHWALTPAGLLYWTGASIDPPVDAEVVG